ncbi:MAG: glycosyltransferase [Flavobacteriales bacterium]|jgi:glycosyltransferase involved in cell wall biosynthesis|nr:glycosyltransferase [Flavobacteriales bacterium]|tara:strand:- start:299 stop:1225 length:927 start_codon:yes stop_codon:yes gene_type:complete
MDLSIILPVYNESDSIKILVNEIHQELNTNYNYEIILIDDGSTDESWNIICELNSVKALRFKKNLGKSAALDVGFFYASGSVVVTMDSDLQDDPKEIPVLYSMIVNDHYDIVSGWKKKRLDPISKTIPTKLYNWATRIMSGINLHDFNCGLKAYSIDVVKDVRLSGEMHRYIPLLAKNAGYNKIGEKVINHRKREFGKTKYGGWNRFSNGLLDLISISFLHKFGKTPMHLFGLLGILFFIIGFLIAGYLTYAKFILYQFNMTDRPLFYLAMLCMIIGTQMFLAGFLGELIIRNKPISHIEKISKKIGF